MEPNEHPISGSGSDSSPVGLNRALLDAALDCIITMDATGHVLEFNAAAQRVFGFSRDQAVGQELASLIIPPELRDRHRAGLRRYLETGEGPVLGQRLEVQALRADGSEILVELAITALRVENQPVFVAYLRDITARNKGEEASRRLAAIIESSDDAIITKDLNGIITSWNTAAERLFGYRPEEIIGKPVITLIPLDRHHEEPHILGRIRQGDRIDHYETVRRRKDGTLFNISVTVSPLKDENGKVIGASKIARDISDRVRNEQRRTAQYAVANLLAGAGSLDEAGPRIIETIAGTGNWVAGSIWLEDKTEPHLNCITTWHQDKAELEAFAKVTSETILAPGSGLPGRVLKAHKPVWIREVRHDADFHRASAAAAANLQGAFAFPLRTEGKVNGVLELFSPETVEPDDDLISLVEALGSQIGLFIHRRQIEAELKEQKEAAESANAAKDRFLATLSHELRTPLTPILIWAGGMVNDPSLPPEVDEGLQMVCRNVELEARLIDDLLDLTRITRGKLQLHLRKSSAHDLLGHAMAIVREEIDSRQLQLSVQFQAADHVVLADAARLQQVFWNLLRNASKFTPAQGAVTVRTANPHPKALTIEISDTGIGIEPDNLEKVFDAFEQVGPRREGLGLGLAISRAIVEMHHGSIRAFSQGPGKGAKFVIDLQTAA
ncbi:MAG TPA: PAS domain S-box protein [Chthoniobacterales bacterium]|nr:PAS domain S-box protein [Chthoniobacterales bacterium]